MFINQIENGLDLSDIARFISAIFETWLDPGQNIQPHYHPDFEEVYYVLLGSGIMTIGDETQEITKGDVVYIPPLAPHTLLNTSNIPLRFVTVTVKISDQNNAYEPE